ELIEQLGNDKFAPEKYGDRVRKRIRALIERKVKGEEIVAPRETKPGAKVVDLMEALRASLARKPAPGGTAVSGGRRRAASSRSKRAAAHARTPARKAGRGFGARPGPPPASLPEGGGPRGARGLGV